jgi:hypothetical protein
MLCKLEIKIDTAEEQAKEIIRIEIKLMVQ